jgi:hypothetical protein
MNDLTIGRHRVIAILAVFAVFVWGVAGHFDRQGTGRFDPLYETDYTIQRIRDGGTHTTAGLQPGDSVISVEGIPVVELGMYSRWPRSLSRRPGDSLTLVVQRGPQLVSREVVLAEPSGGNTSLILGGLVIVLAFVGAGMWALFTVQSVHAVRLAYIGLAVAAAVPGPYLGSWDGVATHFQIAVLVLWTVLLLRFFLMFPHPTRVGQSRIATGLIYGGWMVLLFCLMLELIYHPRLYHTFGPLYGLLMLVYAVLAVSALFHTLVKTPKIERNASGVSVILAGVVIALVPTIIGAVDWAFLWNVDIPGSSWFPLMLGVIPISMAIAIRKHARSTVSPA